MFCMAREGRSIITQFASNLISRSKREIGIPPESSRRPPRNIKLNTRGPRRPVHGHAKHVNGGITSDVLTLTEMRALAAHALAVDVWITRKYRRCVYCRWYFELQNSFHISIKKKKKNQRQLSVWFSVCVYVCV